MTVSRYIDTAEGAAMQAAGPALLTTGTIRAVDVPAAWDYTRLRAAALGRALPNPGNSPGCSPILRELLIESGLSHVIDAEVLNDGDPLGHAGGNALDVRGLTADGTRAIADLCQRLGALFQAVAFTDPSTGVRTTVWMGSPTTTPPSALATYAAICTDHVHLSSSPSRLLAGLNKVDTDYPGDGTLWAPPSRYLKRSGTTPASDGIPNGEVYVAPVGSGSASVDERGAVL